MSMTDPIADMLTRIRNAAQAKMKRVDVPSSKMKLALTKILLREKYISNFKYLTDGKQNVIRICGTRCKAIRADPNGSISLHLGCNTIVHP